MRLVAHWAWGRGEEKNAPMGIATHAGTNWDIVDIFCGAFGRLD